MSARVQTVSKSSLVRSLHLIVTSQYLFMLLCVMLTSGLLCLGDLHKSSTHDGTGKEIVCPCCQLQKFKVGMKAEDAEIECGQSGLYKRCVQTAGNAYTGVDPIGTAQTDCGFQENAEPFYNSGGLYRPVVGQLVAVSIRQIHVFSMHGARRVCGGCSSVPKGGIPAHVVAGLAVALLPLHLLLP